MKKNILLVSLIFILTTNLNSYCQAQNKISINQILEGTWNMDFQQNKRKDYEMYILYNKNKRYQFDYHPSGNGNIYKKNDLNLYEIYFVTDSLISVFEKLDFDEKKILPILPIAQKYFMNDILIENNPNNRLSFNVIHLYRENNKIISFYCWNYTIYKMKEMILDGYGFKPGQPQNGYQFIKTNNIPESIKKIINDLNIGIHNIKTSKAIIYSSPNIISKMYLIQGNQVEVFEEKDGYYHIRYKGAKTVEGWIRKEDCD